MHRTAPYNTGFPAQPWSSEAIGAHGCALEVQQLTLGVSQLGSSRLPALMKMRPGAISALVNNGEPQTLQNWRVTARPLLAVTVNSPGSPWSKRNAACEIPNTVANALPVAF